VFGGYDSDGEARNDMWQFCFETKIWSPVSYQPPPNDASIPMPRYHHSAIVFNAKLYVVGGKTAKPTEDLAVFTFEFGSFYIEPFL
jgi:hypothetical protein